MQLSANFTKGHHCRSTMKQFECLGSWKLVCI